MERSKLEQWAIAEITRRAQYNYAGTLTGIITHHLTDAEEEKLINMIISAPIEDKSTFRPIQEWLDTLDGNSQVVINILEHDKDNDHTLLEAMPDYLSQTQLPATAEVLHNLMQRLSIDMPKAQIEEALAE